jgi:hypothetical protein
MGILGTHCLLKEWHLSVERENVIHGLSSYALSVLRSVSYAIHDVSTGTAFSCLAP